jgi:hypothetical protein
MSRPDKLLLHMQQEFALELASRAELEFGAPVHGKNPG